MRMVWWLLRFCHEQAANRAALTSRALGSASLHPRRGPFRGKGGFSAEPGGYGQLAGMVLHARCQVLIVLDRESKVFIFSERRVELRRSSDPRVVFAGEAAFKTNDERPS